LFPTFALQIDNSIDNLVSYKSIGRTSFAQLNYAQPRVNRSTSNKQQKAPTPTITQDDDDTSVATEATEPCSDSDNERTTGTKTPDEDTDSDEEPQTDEADLIGTTKMPLTPFIMLSKLHANLTNILAVHPCNTAAACEKRTTFDTLKLHKLFGCCRFHNQQYAAASSDNATHIYTGELTTPIGAFATILHPPKGKLIRKRRRYLDKPHMNIAFGD